MLGVLAGVEGVMAEQAVTCEQEGCTEQAQPCWLPDDADEPDSFYCAKHAYDNGFCPGCGFFWSGVEAFDFNPRRLCPNCQSEADASEAAFYGDDDGYPWGDAS